MRRLTPLAVLLFLLLASFTADPSSPGTGQGSPPDATPTTESAQSPSPLTGTYTASLGEPATDVPTATFGFPFTDDDGYTYDIAVWATMTAPVTDISQSKPGYANISYDIVGDLTVVNTTPGRDAALTGVNNVQVGPFWTLAGATECPEMNYHALHRHTWLDGSGPDLLCTQTAQAVTETYLGSLSIPAGGEIAVPMLRQVSMEVEETQLPAIEAMATEPMGWLVTMPEFDADARDYETLCLVDSGSFMPDNPRLHATTDPIDCSLLQADASRNPAPAPGAAQMARTTIEAALANPEATDEYGVPLGCPAGAVEEITRAVSDIDLVELSTMVPTDLAGNPAVYCDGGQVSLELALRTDVNGSPDLTAGARGVPLTGTDEVDIYGGKFYAWCANDATTGYDPMHQCSATWYDDNLVVTGNLAQYEDSTEDQRVERVARWLTVQLPGIIDRLASV